MGTQGFTSFHSLLTFTLQQLLQIIQTIFPSFWGKKFLQKLTSPLVHPKPQLWSYQSDHKCSTDPKTELPNECEHYVYLPEQYAKKHFRGLYIYVENIRARCAATQNTIRWHGVAGLDDVQIIFVSTG